MARSFETANDINQDISKIFPNLGEAFSGMFEDPDKRRLVLSAMDGLVDSARDCRKGKISDHTRSELDRLGKNLTA